MRQCVSLEGYEINIEQNQRTFICCMYSGKIFDRVP